MYAMHVDLPETSQRYEIDVSVWNFFFSVVFLQCLKSYNNIHVEFFHKMFVVALLVLQHNNNIIDIVCVDVVFFVVEYFFEFIGFYGAAKHMQ